MFIPFLAAAAVAAAFAKLGAMSVQIAVLTLALQALSVAFLAAMSIIALSRRVQRGSQQSSFLSWHALFNFLYALLGRGLASSDHC